VHCSIVCLLLVLVPMMKTLMNDAVRARELARQKREMCQRFMKEEQARRLEECRQAHERQKAEDQRIAEIAREKALKDEQFRAKKASDDNTRQLVRQQVAARNIAFLSRVSTLIATSVCPSFRLSVCP